ncbi:UDP-glucose dehydrogenase [Aequoribacter fuscus]|uniref:UDP-glucose dehydrogenase n=1 Tax=Aequoribacter fuscus TaxID=2518989 RepID=F3KY86_9GAMM|nr:Vi polysaccharide biosynthesis UDP-N-acetylglucosamine C-6 dehydrogenase TviB [Aequoribacter fuscus]EGG30942.1 UDP-glucose dehydrogenase [Aequoribacter fuscus]
MTLPALESVQIGVIGLGYVGLPLAVAFGTKQPVVGFDVDPKRIAQLTEGHDVTGETSAEALASASQLSLSADPEQLRLCQVFIITVPTPINADKQPDLSPLVAASETVGKYMPKGAIVIYESTVYPGATEDDCVPVLEQYSGLTFNQDFWVGYSPERINPGDKQRQLPDIVKVTSGSTPEIADFVDQLYASVIRAGTYRASSIRVAEAAKVIENTQRDLNIALVNELAIIFNRLGIDTQEVLEAAGTKWNFLPFRPGLVGGHCIGIDPYYLTYRAQAVGYIPDVILAGRRINSNMGAYVADELVKAMLRKRLHVAGSRILVLGFTFKENCRDVRNTRVVDIIAALAQYGAEVDVYDPWVDIETTELSHGRLVDEPDANAYQGLLLAVAHEQFHELDESQLNTWLQTERVIYDLKYVLPKDLVDLRL